MKLNEENENKADYRHRELQYGNRGIHFILLEILEQLQIPRS